MRLCKDCKKAHEMVVASMEYVKTLGQRIRVTEEQGEIWKKTAQTHADECVQLRMQLLHLQTANESGMPAQVVKERDALRSECDDLRRVERERHRQTAVVTQSVDVPRTHPVKVGEYLRRLTGFNTTPAGEIAQVIRVHVGTESNSYEYEVLRPNGQPGAWASKNCAPCDQPEATHGDVVRLVRVPTQQDYPMAAGTWLLDYGKPGECGTVEKPPHINCMGVAVVAMDNGWQWPLSCVEMVKGATDQTGGAA